MFSAKTIAYKDTGFFSRIVLDYLEGNEKTRPFYSFDTTPSGIRDAIQAKQKRTIDRQMLVSVLREQYNRVQTTDAVSENIEKLLSSNTFTICTAHQPNLFTGPLYFLYKIIHVIKLASYCKDQFPEYEFVPVFYMGSEDADTEELNHFVVEGKRYEWKTNQSGAVGRMKVDKQVLSILNELEQQLGVEKYGDELMAMLRTIFTEGKTMMQGTMELVNELFGEYGVVVLLPDSAILKSGMKPVFEDDLFHQTPSGIVRQTCEALGAHYNIQAQPRDINLFYLKDDVRERFDFVNDKYLVNNTTLSFTGEELKNLLNSDPSVFSPNVILRGLFQETILPNIIFVGGGGEIAYWLQLKDLFDHYEVPFPMLVVRNSFLLGEKKWMKKVTQSKLRVEDFFLSEKELIDNLVKQVSVNEISLNGSYKKTEDLFNEITERAGAIDSTLTRHVAALKERSMHYLKELEKKMLRSEKRKYADKLNQVSSVKNALFPGNSLQERVENFSSFYAKWGKEMIDELYKNSPALEQEFTIIEEKDQSN